MVSSNSQQGLPWYGAQPVKLPPARIRIAHFYFVFSILWGVKGLKLFIVFLFVCCTGSWLLCWMLCYLYFHLNCFALLVLSWLLVFRICLQLSQSIRKSMAKIVYSNNNRKNTKSYRSTHIEYLAPTLVVSKIINKSYSTFQYSSCAFLLLEASLQVHSNYKEKNIKDS